MKAPISIPGTAGSARLTVLGCAALMVLVSATVSACTGSPPSSSLPAIFSPSGSASHSTTATSTSTSTGSPTETSASPATTTPSPATTTPTPTVTTVTPTAPTPTTYYPTGAPETGGGGTAGLQNGLAIGLGGTAMLAGLGSLAYRRRLTRRRR
jgi:cytoskeletal protein RodZ